jgi:hypothetical protein
LDIMKKCSFVVAGMLLLSTAVGQAQTPNFPSVQVPGTRNPVDKSYRKMLLGIARFEQQRPILAPQARLRFALLPRVPGVSMTGITLAVRGDNISLPVPVADDNSFTLPSNDQAWREDAALVANRHTSTMTWRADVRSPGVPQGQRRLGDLRLECLVGMEAGLVSNNARLFAWLGALLNGPDRVCHADDGNYLFFSERPLFAVHLRDGARQATLPGRMLYAGGMTGPSELPYCDCQMLLDRSYFAPLWDKQWSDDTLLSFEYMDEPDPPDALPAPGIAAGMDKEQVQARLGPATEVRFLSGMTAWLYPLPAQHWILFDVSGHVLKSRRL